MVKLTKKELWVGIMLLLSVSIIIFLVRIRIVLLPFVFGIILAYLFYPFVNYLLKRNYSRPGAIILLLITVTTIFLLMGIILFPIFIEEMEGLTIMIPRYINAIEKNINYLTREYKRLSMPLMIKEVIDQYLQEMEKFAVGFIQKTTERLLYSISFVFSILLAPIISYYILKDLDYISRSFLRLIPRKNRRFFQQLGKETNKIFVGYLRGQIWVSIIVSVLCAFGLYLLQIKFYLILGIVAGITNMIPYIGPIIGVVPAALIAMLASPLKALGVILLYFFIQQVESSIIAPKIMSENVGLHPLLIIFALLASAELIGTWGLIFAVPIAGSIKVVIKLIIQQLTPLNREPR